MSVPNVKSEVESYLQMNLIYLYVVYLITTSSRGVLAS